MGNETTTKNKIILITGSLGLIGFETAVAFMKKGYSVAGVDNNMRATLLGLKTDYKRKLRYIQKHYSDEYIHNNTDIRDERSMESIFKKYGKKIDLIIHTAAQTSHEWSAQDPSTDFSINTHGTFILLNLFRIHSPDAVFVFTSTNKVYGDTVNDFRYKEYKKRYDLETNNRFYNGITEDFSIDQSKHSPFGVSKAAADLLVQEFGRYFNLKTGIFRLGVVASGGQNGAFEQGFLSYMIHAFEKGQEFRVLGYKGKQVRDIIHAKDVARAFYLYHKNPLKGEVFNLGGGRKNSASVLELIEKVSAITGKKPDISFRDSARSGDHKWWISDYSKFKNAYSAWNITHSVDDIIRDIYQKRI